jgi:3-hydroxy-9,10-secoandrosta-1,3,5(10)-triene-9,17-dione monooxygenase
MIEDMSGVTPDWHHVLTRALEQRTEATMDEPGPLVTALSRAGLLGLTSKPPFATCSEIAEALLEVASLDGSLGWLLAVQAGGAWFQQVFDEPDVKSAVEGGHPPFIASSFRPTLVGTWVDGGEAIRINGSVSMFSGIEICDWAIVRVRTEDRGDDLLALLPREDFLVVPSWEGVGIRSAGNHTATFDGVRIGVDRVVLFSAFFQRQRANGTGVPIPPVSVSASFLLVAALLGMSTAMVEEAKQVTRSQLGGPDAFPVPLAEAIAALDACGMRLTRMSRLLDATGSRTPTAMEHAQSKADVWEIVRGSRHAAELAADVIGSRAFVSGTRFERAWRDLQTASRHKALRPESISAAFHSQQL